MKRPNLKRATAILGCAASLAATGAVAVPAATAAAPRSQSCGSKVITVPVKGAKPAKVVASRISVQGGATCRNAYTVIRGVVTKEMPRGWTVSRGNFKVPNGLTPQVAVNGHKKVMFAVPGPGR